MAVAVRSATEATGFDACVLVPTPGVPRCAHKNARSVRADRARMREHSVICTCMRPDNRACRWHTHAAQRGRVCAHRAGGGGRWRVGGVRVDGGIVDADAGRRRPICWLPCPWHAVTREVGLDPAIHAKRRAPRGPNIQVLGHRREHGHARLLVRMQAFTSRVEQARAALHSPHRSADRAPRTHALARPRMDGAVSGDQRVVQIASRARAPPRELVHHRRDSRGDARGAIRVAPRLKAQLGLLLREADAVRRSSGIVREAPDAVRAVFDRHRKRALLVDAKRFERRYARARNVASRRRVCEQGLASAAAGRAQRNGVGGRKQHVSGGRGGLEQTGTGDHRRVPRRPKT